MTQEKRQDTKKNEESLAGILFRFIRSTGSPSHHSHRSDGHVFLVVGCFAVQMLLTAVLWNRYVEKYQILLESPATSERYAVRCYCQPGGGDMPVNIVISHLFPGTGETK